MQFRVVYGILAVVVKVNELFIMKDEESYENE